jgi:hypothetical protein
MLLRFIFRGCLEKRQTPEKPEIIKKLNETDQTKQDKPNLTPRQIGGHFKHSISTVRDGKNTGFKASERV